MSLSSSKPPTIAIVGAGAIGTYYGARLSLAGNDVRLLMRSDRDHVRAHGVRLVERERTLMVKPLQVFAAPAEIGLVDWVLITLKTTANASLAQWLPPLLHADTKVVTLQNGLGNEELVASLVGAERTLGGLCFIASTRTAPGEVTCYHPGSITLGEFGRPAQERTRFLANLFQAAGVKCMPVDNLAQARWRKLVWNVPFNGLSIAAGGITTDRILADPTLAREVRVLMDEVAGAARRLGYDIPESFIQDQIDVTVPMGAYAPSTLVDFRAGRELEIEPIWGEPLRQAQAAGLAMPRLAALYAKLQRL
ncbi:putative 2-dehydropantoate 2-reductase [Opitutaceae bacterium]